MSSKLTPPSGRPVVPRCELKYRRVPSGDKAGPVVSLASCPTRRAIALDVRSARSTPISRLQPSSVAMISPSGVTVMLQLLERAHQLRLLALYGPACTQVGPTS